MAVGNIVVRVSVSTWRLQVAVRVMQASLWLVSHRLTRFAAPLPVWMYEKLRNNVAWFVRVRAWR